MTVVATLTIKPETRAELESPRHQDRIGITRKEKGCIPVRLHESMTDPERFGCSRKTINPYYSKFSLSLTPPSTPPLRPPTTSTSHIPPLHSHPPSYPPLTTQSFSPPPPPPPRWARWTT